MRDVNDSWVTVSILLNLLYSRYQMDTCCSIVSILAIVAAAVAYGTLRNEISWIDELHVHDACYFVGFYLSEPNHHTLNWKLFITLIWKIDRWEVHRCNEV